MSNKNNLNKDQLEKVNGGGTFKYTTEITHRDFTGQTVKFVSKKGNNYEARVVSNGVIRTLYFGEYVFVDVYELKFKSDYQAYWGGWYSLGNAMDYFREESKVEESEVFSKVSVF